MPQIIYSPRAVNPTTTTSVGAADSGKLPMLDGSGKLDTSFLYTATVSYGNADYGKVPLLGVTGTLDISCLPVLATVTATKGLISTNDTFFTAFNKLAYDQINLGHKELTLSGSSNGLSINNNTPEQTKPSLLAQDGYHGFWDNGSFGGAGDQAWDSNEATYIRFIGRGTPYHSDAVMDGQGHIYGFPARTNTWAYADLVVVYTTLSGGSVDYSLNGGITWVSVDASGDGVKKTATLPIPAIQDPTLVRVRAKSTRGNVNLSGDPRVLIFEVTIAGYFDTHNQVMSLALATSSNNGALSSADWTTFNKNLRNSGAYDPIANTPALGDASLAQGHIYKCIRPGTFINASNNVDFLRPVMYSGSVTDPLYATDLDTAQNYGVPNYADYGNHGGGGSVTHARITAPAAGPLDPPSPVSPNRPMSMVSAVWGGFTSRPASSVTLIAVLTIQLVDVHGYIRYPLVDYSVDSGATWISVPLTNIGDGWNPFYYANQSLTGVTDSSKIAIRISAVSEYYDSGVYNSYPCYLNLYDLKLQYVPQIPLREGDYIYSNGAYWDSMSEYSTLNSVIFSDGSF